MFKKIHFLKYTVPGSIKNFRMHSNYISETSRDWLILSGEVFL